MKRLIYTILALGILGAGAWFWFFKDKNSAPQIKFITSPIEKGTLQQSISATGTIEPEELIDVGAQVGGKILSFGKDVNGKELDYGSIVKKGMTLAIIDDQLYQSDLATSSAEVARSEANLARANAELIDAKNKAVQTQIDWDRAQKLGKTAIAGVEFDQYKFAAENAATAVLIKEASLKEAKATLSMAKTKQERAQRDLSYCTIISPVDGIIIDRKVNIGQTVVSSMNAPSLFLIAKDLRKLQVWCAVNEADIGQIQPGQHVDFTVDTFPNKNFHGIVNKVRLNATMSSNVVTYIVEVDVDNKDNVLLPYLTANTKFIIKESSNEWLVPNSALRWQPKEETLVQAGSQNVEIKHGEELIWVEENGKAKPIPVQIGLANSVNSVISSNQLKEGLQVITNIEDIKEEKVEAKSQNPFMPKMPQRKRNKVAGSTSQSNTAPSSPPKHPEM